MKSQAGGSTSRVVGSSSRQLVASVVEWISRASGASRVPSEANSAQHIQGAAHVRGTAGQQQPAGHLDVR